MAKKFNLTERLSPWEIRDGIVVNRDRTLEIGLEIKPPPTMMFSAAAVANLNNSIRYIMRETVPEGERGRLILEATPIRRPVIDQYEARNGGSTPVIEQMAKNKADIYRVLHDRGSIQDWCMYLTVTIRAFRKKNPVQLTAFSTDEWIKAKAVAKLVRDKLLADFNNANMMAKALDDQAFFGLMWRYCNVSLNRAQSPTFVPTEKRDLAFAGERYLKNNPTASMQTLREQLTSSSVMNEHPTFIQNGDTYVSLISMTGLPSDAYFGISNKTLPSDGNFYMVLDFEHCRQQQEIRKLMDNARSNTGMAAGDGISAFVDPNKIAQVREQTGALGEIAQSNAHIITCGMVIVFTGHSREELLQRRNRLYSAFASMPGVRVMAATFDCFSQWMNVMPGNGRSSEYMRMTLDSGWANLFPLASPWHGSRDAVALYGNRYGSITCIDPFDRDAPNWNGIVVGGSGNGKSFFMQQMAADLLKEGAELYVIDRGYSYSQLVTLAGGAIIPIEPGKSSINAFDLSPHLLAIRESDPEEFKEGLQQRIGFITTLVQAMVPTEDVERGTVEYAILGAAIRKVYEFALSEVIGDDDQVVLGFDVPTMSDLERALTTLTAIGDRPASAGELEVAALLATRLGSWIGDSPLARFVDRKTNVEINGQAVYFETSGFKTYAALNVVGMLLVSDLVWRRVERNRSTKKLVIWDEWGTMLENAYGVKRAVEMFRTARKYNAAIYAVTQTLSDFTRPDTQGILQSSAFNYLFKLSGEDELVQSCMKLSDWAMTTFKSLTRKQGEYSEAMAWIRYEDRVEGEVIRVQPSREEYWAFTTKANEIVIRDEAITRYDGDVWRAIQACAVGNRA